MVYSLKGFTYAYIITINATNRMLRSTHMHTHIHKCTDTYSSFLLLKTKQWTNVDRSVTVATATPHAYLELNKQ